MIPLRLVIDTNILVSAALKPDGLQRTVLVLAITKPARPYVTEAVLAEYREVLSRPELKIRRGLREQLLQLVKEPCASRQPSACAPGRHGPRRRQVSGVCRCCPCRLPGNRQPATFTEVLEEVQGDHVSRVHQHRGTASHFVRKPHF